jgi:lipoate-protein ligase B
MLRCRYVDLGTVDYEQALDLQRRMADFRARDDVEDDFLLLLEHFPVVTIGTRDMPLFRMPREDIEKGGIRVIDTNRGGGATYHGPGQLVAYPIVDFSRRFGYPAEAAQYQPVPYPEVSKYTAKLEEVMRLTLADFGITNIELKKGIWHQDNKLGSRGVAVALVGKRLVTMHGSALDVNTDQSPFELIYPCGHTDKGVTSMRKILGREVPMGEVKSSFARNFGTVFDYQMETATIRDLLG